MGMGGSGWIGSGLEEKAIMIRSAVLLSALIGGCSPAPRGWLVDVHGFVLDAAGDGVSGASIELSNLDTETSIGTVYSDDSGRWSLPLFVSESESEFEIRIRDQN